MRYDGNKICLDESTNECDGWEVGNQTLQTQDTLSRVPKCLKDSSK